MSKSNESEGLIARLEAATGRTPEIEAAIYNALVGPEDGNRIAFKVKDWSKLPGSRLSPFHDGWLIGKSEIDEYADNMPAYTASIDAALALVERVLPNYRWGVSAAGIKRGAHPDGKPAYMEGFRAHVTEHSALRPMPSVADAPTAPLAILIALFRALSARPRP